MSSLRGEASQKYPEAHSCWWHPGRSGRAVAQEGGRCGCTVPPPRIVGRPAARRLPPLGRAGRLGCTAAHLARKSARPADLLTLHRLACSYSELLARTSHHLGRRPVHSAGTSYLVECMRLRLGRRTLPLLLRTIPRLARTPSGLAGMTVHPARTWRLFAGAKIRFGSTTARSECRILETLGFPPKAG